MNTGVHCSDKMLISILKGSSALVDRKPGSKAQQTPGKSSRGHSVPILTFPHWSIQEEMPTYASELLQVPWRSFRLTLDHLEWEWSVGDPDITLAGSHLIRGVSWAQSKRSLNCSFLLIYTDKVRLRGDWSSNILLSFPLCCCRRPPFLKQAEYMDVNSALQERSYISRCVFWVFSQPLCRFGMRWETWRSKSLVQT